MEPSKMLKRFSKHLFATAVVGTLGLSAGLVGGCTKKAAPTEAPPPPKVENPCAAGTAALIEQHNKEDAVDWSLLPGAAADTFTLCDGKSQSLGTLSRTADSITVKGPSGQPVAALAIKSVEEATLTVGAESWKVVDMSDLLRILDGAGQALGQLGRQGTRAIAFGPAGAPVATAQKATDSDKKVVRAPDGDVMLTFVGMTDERAAATFALAKLTLPAQVVLARWMESKPRVEMKIPDEPPPQKGKGKGAPKGKAAEPKKK